MPSYDYRCPDCEITEILVVKYEERDFNQPCSMCGKNSLVRFYGKMPGVTRASYIDSNKTARAREFINLKKAAQLEVDKANLPPEKRGEINSEIKKLTQVKK
jgi:putative FmdB family regulatory protein